MFHAYVHGNKHLSNSCIPSSIMCLTWCACSCCVPGATHLLGSYFDAWRRGHYKYTGQHMANGLHVKAVMCDGCTVKTARFRMEQIRSPVRAGGPVTCTVDAACKSDAAFNAAVEVGNITAARFFSNMTSCSAFMCTRAGDTPLLQPLLQP